MLFVLDDFVFNKFCCLQRCLYIGVERKQLLRETFFNGDMFVNIYIYIDILMDVDL